MDFGNMLSMVVGQEDGRVFRCLKEFYCLPPEWVRRLADKFLSYYAPHKQNTINLYYDRAGNNYQKSHQSMAMQLKEALEKDGAGARTGWRVTLMSLGQGNITMNDEYVFMREVMSGHNHRLPDIRIDAINCRILKAALERAKTKLDSKGRVGKDKSDEKSADPRRLLASTNPTDAFKYLTMRKAWVAIVKRSRGGLPGGGAGDVGVVGR
jgi:hypothetical protein